MCVAGENGGEIDGTRAFCSIESPNGLRAQRIHVHRFGAVTPAGGDGKGETDIFTGEEGIGLGRFGRTTDALVGNDAFEV